MSKKSVIYLGVVYFFSTVCSANQWVRNVEVMQISSYQRGSGHFVWLSGAVSECASSDPSNPVVRFNDNESGGKSMMTLLTAALVAKRKVDINVNGCDISEIYLK